MTYKQKLRVKKRLKQKLRAKKMLRQKACGLVLLFISIATVPIGNDATFAIIGVLFGLYLIFTRKYWMY